MKLLLDSGSGGRASHRLINDLFLRHFDNSILRKMDDGALLDPGGPIAMSTDGYTVTPLFFPGGDIGSLAINGTVNDVAMMGAKPLYLACAFILEEGLDLALLEKVVISMANAARAAGVQIVTGDTKVVPHGACDQMFITSTGIGRVVCPSPPSGHNAMDGDAILISGSLGDHGLTVMAMRDKLSFVSDIQSDCAPLSGLVQELLTGLSAVHVLRDPTRGGLATTLNEIADQSGLTCVIEEAALPIHANVRAGCDILGLDPLYLANEGKLICVVPQTEADKALAIMRAHEYGREAAIIGSFSTGKSQVKLLTRMGGSRMLSMLEGAPLPRIC